MGKTLVAYFSATGTTERAAKLLAERLHAELFEIRPLIPYTKAELDWNDEKSRSTLEMSDPSARPAIAESCGNMDEYDTVFLGFPIWWYVAPAIIRTFLEAYDFSGKTIIPFATSGGSGMGKTDSGLHALCPDTVSWRPGKRFKKSVSAEELENWAGGLGL